MPGGTNHSEFDGLIKNIHDAGQAWVDAEFRARQLEEDQKPYLASLINALDDGDTSEAKLERKARGSKEYRNYITGMVTARAEALRLKVKYEAWQSTFEARRTESANQRVINKLAPGY
jgi:hypothetical protein